MPQSTDKHAHFSELEKESHSAQALRTLRLQYEVLESKYAALSEHTVQSEAINSFAPDMLKQDSVDNLLQLVATEIVNLTQANGAYMLVVNETQDYQYVAAACGNLQKNIRGPIRKHGPGLSELAWRSGQTQYTDNNDKNYHHMAAFPDTIKAVAIPIFFSGNILGIALVTAEVEQDLLSQISFLELIAQKAGMAIYCTAQIESQKKELQRTKALSALGDTLNQTTDKNDILNSITAHLFEIFDIDRVSIYQETENDKQLALHATHVKTGQTIASSEQQFEAITEHSIVNWCYRNNQFSQINRHVYDSEEDSVDAQAFHPAECVGSTMCIPINYNEKPWTVITITKQENKRDFDETEANVFHAVANQVSTTLQRNNLLVEVQHQAYHDSLTNLPNRRSFERRVREQIKDASVEKFAILFCDLDGFKVVNDSHGHDIGDVVLNMCAAKMSECIQDDDYLARIGGDEFAIMINLSDDHKNLEAIANKFVKTLSKPIQANTLRVRLGASIGISVYPKDGRTFSELLNCADIAMYQAKQSGKGKVLHFNKNDATIIRNKNELRAELKNALSKNEFELWYQPQVHLASSTVTGVEALIRWNHPKGMIQPAEFIPVAEESGLIDPLGMWVIEEALMKLSSGALSTNSKLYMSVNVAPSQFLETHFSAKVLAMLDKYKVNPSQLKIEITESFILHSRETVVKHLDSLRENGVKVAIFDFGIGYSSLSYLQDLPVDFLKIHGSFISTLTQSNYANSIAASIIALANTLGLTTIAEGVETEEQHSLIEQLGCQVIQGYYYSKPVPASDLPDTIERIEGMNSTRLRKIA